LTIFIIQYANIKKMTVLIYIACDIKIKAVPLYSVLVAHDINNLKE